MTNSTKSTVSHLDTKTIINRLTEPSTSKRAVNEVNADLDHRMAFLKEMEELFEATKDESTKLQIIKILALLHDFNTHVRVRGVAINDPSPELRLQAIKYIGEVGVTNDFHQLMEIIGKDRSPSEVIEATKSIGLIKAIAAAPFVERGLKHKDADVRRESLITLGKLRSADSVPEITAMAHTHPEITGLAVTSLIEIASTTAIPFLEEVAKGDSPQAAMARQALYVRFGVSTFHPDYRERRNDRTFFDPNESVSAIDHPKDALLGGKLLGTTMHAIPADVAQAWASAADPKKWKSSGLDYIPIAPLLTREEVMAKVGADPNAERYLAKEEARLTSEGQVVYSKIGGPSLEDFGKTASESELDALRKERNRIQDTLLDLDPPITHPHFYVDLSRDGPHMFFSPVP